MKKMTIPKAIEELVSYTDNLDLEKYSTEIENHINVLLANLKQADTLEYSTQYQSLVNNLKPLNIVAETHWMEKNQRESTIKSKVSDFMYQLNTIKQLELIGKIKNDKIVIVGANGVGKSSFATYISETLLNSNINVIPAQKYLVIDERTGRAQGNREDVTNFQKLIKPKNTNFDITDDLALRNIFTNLIDTILSEDSKSLLFNKYEGSKEESGILYFKKIRNVFSQLFPGIQLHVEKSSRQAAISAEKNGEKYVINALSDGEKVAIYFITNVLLANPDSFIIIDEPETFLNENISTKLWDILEQERRDCKFIYITHNVDFVSTRKNNDSSLIWLKSCDLKNKNWEFQLVNESEFPDELLISLLGNKKGVLFVEGETSSPDYLFYESLFGEDYTIYPVGGSNNVKEYTRAYNKQKDLFRNAAIGIIDFDLRSTREVEELSRDHIFINEHCNEIEMAYLIPEILEKALMIFGKDSSSIIETFKNELKNTVMNNREKILIQKVKSEIELNRATQKLGKSESISDLKGCYLKISSVEEFDKVAEEARELIDEILDGELDYAACLKVCNLKGVVSALEHNVFTNSITTSFNYRNSVIRVLQDNKELRERVKVLYYKEIVDLKNNS